MMPKIELHAHLNGSLTAEILHDLHDLHLEKYPNDSIPEFQNASEWFLKGNAGFDRVYEIFVVAQKLTDNPEAVTFATRLVIMKCADDNVKYLELRSTPRETPGKMSREDYVKAVLDGIRSSKNENIITTYILSIDRRKPVAVAKETLELCLKFQKLYPDLVVGLDVSGDARVNDLEDFKEVLLEAKEKGLKLTIHLAEVFNLEETKMVLKEIKPQRIGHGTRIHPLCEGHTEIWNLLKKSKIPTEICITSNICCKTATEEQHHLIHFWEEKLPFTLATDDLGVFKTDLSIEFQKAASYIFKDFSGDKKHKDIHRQLLKLTESSIEMIFGGEQVKEFLRIQVEDFQIALQ